jgi:fumarate hydratase class II
MGTALAPVIGYDRAVEIVKAAAESGRTVREVALEMSGLDKTALDDLLEPARQAGPQPAAAGSAADLGAGFGR